MKTSIRKPLRLWPGVVILVLQWLVRFALPIVAPDALLYAVFSGMIAAAAIILWWLLLSRARWFERLGALLLIALGMFVTSRVIDISLATGAQGFLFYFLAIPIIADALVVGAVATRYVPERLRHATMATAILLACGIWICVKTGGFTASTFKNDLHWRWAKTSEERLLTKSANELGALPPAPPAVPSPSPTVVSASPKPPEKPAAVTETALPRVPVAAKIPNNEPAPVAPAAIRPEPEAKWPGFRGPQRNDVLTGVRISTDWSASPPVQLWRRPVGPGWSSFAVRGDLIFTQEQRGPDEIIACYKLTSGEPVWAHRDPARFWESNGGPGPRGTPTLSGGRVYTFGATGIVNVLNAADGSVVWSRNAASDTGMKTPQWGFASSPLVVDDLVIVGVAGELAAYDRANGTRRWTGPAHGVSYSSPQLATLGGVRQVLLLSEAGLTSLALPDGTLLWDYAWKGYPIVQPNLTADGDILISTNMDSGTRRLAVSRGPAGWNPTERWTSNGLKPYFNDFVVHKGYAYGFDGSILACIDLNDGKRKWKGGRYGNGQLLLLSDEDLLVVLSEEGEIALVSATPDQFKEFAHAPAIEGKTWNHPVLAGDVLLVRNGQEMAAFRLAAATGTTASQ